MNCLTRFSISIALSAFAVGAPAFAQPPDQGTPPIVEPNPNFSSDLLRYVEDNLPIQCVEQNRFEAQCYEQLLLHARRLPAELLSRSSSRRINFAHLFGEDRGRYRGELVHIEGRLRLLREYPAPPTLAGLDAGLTTLYEGWIFVEEFGGNPYCVVCTELPADLRPAETIDRPVETDAFFFKRYRYGARDGLRDAPFLIGKSIRPTSAVTASSASPWQMPAAAVTGVLAIIGLTVAVAGGTVWWFRRQDRLTRQQVALALEKARNPAPEDV